MKILGILEIDNRTDVLAFAAFLISVLSIGYNVKEFIKGSDVVLVPPPSVVIAAANYQVGAARYIVTIAPFAYANRGYEAYSSIVTREILRFTIDERVVEQEWMAFVATTTEASVFDLSSSLKPVFKEGAAPFVIGGGDSKSHETFLASRTESCSASEIICDANRNYVTLQQFISQFEQLTHEDGPRVKEFKLEIAAEVIGDGPFRRDTWRRRTCTIEIRLQDLEAIENPDVGYFSRPCSPRNL